MIHEKVKWAALLSSLAFLVAVAGFAYLRSPV